MKLLDAGQRLPLHVHPDRGFATEHLASPYGKTEAWMIVSARPGAYVHLGFDRDVEAGELAGWVAGQKTEQMLAAINRIPVTAGDAILCPAGLPHAIGDGILLVEIQEPTDFSVLLEYEVSAWPTVTWSSATTWPCSASTAAAGARPGSSPCAAPAGCWPRRRTSSSPRAGCTAATPWSRASASWSWFLARGGWAISRCGAGIRCWFRTRPARCP
ncbi:class I mannose-6-phosphate isomerase [Streptomyces sp. NPDC052236]|uniref:class I mannose-6-phosphate isomerase n=1 Tax=Streptomyces sp. NPDC052236 TaxID=3365686 RepID=UPI0037D1BC44